MTKRMIFKRIACALLATFALLLSSCVREEKKEPVGIDKVVEVMKKTGHDLPSLYKETSEGGLARDYKQMWDSEHSTMYF